MNHLLFIRVTHRKVVFCSDDKKKPTSSCLITYHAIIKFAMTREGSNMTSCFLSNWVLLLQYWGCAYKSFKLFDFVNSLKLFFLPKEEMFHRRGDSPHTTPPPNTYVFVARFSANVSWALERVIVIIGYIVSFITEQYTDRTYKLSVILNILTS